MPEGLTVRLPVEKGGESRGGGGGCPAIVSVKVECPGFQGLPLHEDARKENGFAQVTSPLGCSDWVGQPGF